MVTKNLNPLNTQSSTQELLIPIFYKGYRAENKYSNRGNYEAALNFQKIINEAKETYPKIICRLYNIDETNDIIYLGKLAIQKRNIPFLISCCQQDHLNSSLEMVRVQRPELNIIYSNSHSNSGSRGTKYSKYPKYSNSYLYSKILGHEYFPSYYGEIYRTDDDHRRTLDIFQRMLGDDGPEGYEGLYKHEIEVNVGVYNRPDVVPDQICDYDELIHKMIKENDIYNSWRPFYSKPKVNLKFVILGSSDVRFTFDTRYINYITTDPKVFYKDIDLYLYPTIKNTDPIPNSQVICALNRIPIATNTVRGAKYSSKDELQFCTNEVTRLTPPISFNKTKSKSYQSHLLPPIALINEALRGMFIGYSQINISMLDTNQDRAKQLLQETKDALLDHLKKLN